jgi:hypothetical protein
MELDLKGLQWQICLIYLDDVIVFGSKSNVLNKVAPETVSKQSWILGKGNASFFVTKYGLYEYKTLPMGLCNGPPTCQRLMELVLNGLQWQICLI